MRGKNFNRFFRYICPVALTMAFLFMPLILQASGISARMRYAKRMSEAFVLEAAVSPDSKYLVTLNGDHRVGIWDLQNGKLVRSLEGHRGRLMRTAISADGRLLATGSFSGEKIKIWELATGEFIREFAEFIDLSSLAFSQDGKILAISGIPKKDKNNCTVELWDVEKGTEIATLEKKHSGRFYPGSLCFSPDGKHLAAAIQNKMHGIMIWDIASKKLVKNIPHSDDVVAIDYSPDGLRIVGGGMDSKAYVWDAQTGKILYAMPGHSAHVTGVSFHPDGRYFATSSFGSKSRFRIWDAQTGQQVYAMSELRGRTQNVFFSRDGKTLVVVITTYGNLGDPSTLEVYDLDMDTKAH